jgi:hypothetical protein
MHVELALALEYEPELSAQHARHAIETESLEQRIFESDITGLRQHTIICVR